MNQDLSKFNSLKDNIINIEIKLAIVESDLLAIEKDLIFLGNMHQNLKENIITLRAHGIIVIASEYKKIIQEFETVTKNIAFYDSLHSSLLNKFHRYCKLRDRAIIEYEEFKKFFESRQTVVKFDLSKRKK